MTDLRTIVAQIVSGAPFPSKRSQNKAIDILDAIEAAGFRILGPDEVDPVTVEKCAGIADADGRRELSWAEMSLPVSPGPVIAKDRAAVSDRIASAIRAIGRKA